MQPKGTARVLVGNGSPEGARTAPVGYLYLRLDGAAGTTLYVKETGTGNIGWTAISPGSGSAPRETVPVVDSSQASSQYANNLRYVPLIKGNSDYLYCQFVAPVTGTIEFIVHFAMSAAAANNVRLRTDRNVISAGGNPTQAITTGTAFTVAVTNDVLDHQVDSGDSADMSFAVTALDKVWFYFTRLSLDGADTHAGDMRVTAIEWTIT